MRKVAVIASASGCGKTTAGRALAARLDVPFVELDALNHGAGWVEPTPEELRARVVPIVATDGWVIDGGYREKLGDLVLGAADTVLWLDLPVREWLPRLLRRTVVRIVRREKLWGGNRETFRGAFVGRDALIPYALRGYRPRQRGTRTSWRDSTSSGCARSARSTPGSRPCRRRGSTPPKQRHRLRRETLAAARETEAIGRRRTNVDLLSIHAQRSGQPFAHQVPVRSDARALADQDAVRVDELEAGLANLAICVGEKPERVRAAIALVSGRKESPDVGKSCGAEERVGQRMRDHVAVRVADQALRVVERHAAEDERNAVAERVGVDAEPDPRLAHAPAAAARPSRAGSSANESIGIAPVGVACSRPHGPRLRWTATRPAASAGAASLSARSPT